MFLPGINMRAALIVYTLFGSVAVAGPSFRLAIVEADGRASDARRVSAALVMVDLDEADFAGSMVTPSRTLPATFHGAPLIASATLSLGITPEKAAILADGARRSRPGAALVLLKNGAPISEVPIVHSDPFAGPEERPIAPRVLQDGRVVVPLRDEDLACFSEGVVATDGAKAALARR